MTDKTTQKIEFTEDDIKKALCDYLLKANIKCKPEEISLDVGSRCVGYGIAEHDEYYVKASATISLEL